jgi:hypothetical protein
MGLAVIISALIIIGLGCKLANRKVSAGDIERSRRSDTYKNML